MGVPYMLGRTLRVGLAVFLTQAPPCEARLIQINVEVTEVNDQKAHDLGIEWFDEIRVQEGWIPGILAVGDLNRLTPLRADLKFLMTKGAAELLANPKLVTDDGTAAIFRAGGQIPYIVSGSLGTSNVEFKAFGVTLEIKPRLTGEGYIQTSIRAAVSSLDLTSSVSLSGNTVPGILEREVSSLVTVKSGTTITLAGLVQRRREKRIRGVPVLSWIPVLGLLFSRQRWENVKTTVIIFVTPSLTEEPA